MFKLQNILLASASLGLGVSSMVSAADVFEKKEAALIPIAAFTANGDMNGLKTSINEGLDAGLTINQIKEVLTQLYAYAGFPRSLNAINALMQVLDARQANGLDDPEGATSRPLPSDRTSLEFGTDNQTKLIGQEIKGGMFDFAPEADYYLKAHLFGDIFERDVLSWKQREIATIAALASIDGVQSQLTSHYHISMNNGVSKDELAQFVTILDTKVSHNIAQNAQDVLTPILGHEVLAQAEQSVYKKAEQQSFVGDDKIFTGKVSVDMIFPENDEAHLSAAYVNFEAGARSAWHEHPAGQHLIVTKGTALTGTRDGKVLAFHEGEAVWCPKGIDHWHGATKDAAMTHIALTPSKDGQNVVWKEKVTDEDYLKGQE